MKLFRRKFNKKRLEQELQGHTPPALPGSAMKVLRMLRDPEVGMQSIAKALSFDASLSVQLLKTVNSAAYGPAREIDNVGHAASMLGRNQLEQLVLAVAVKQALPNGDIKGFEAMRFWKSSFFRAVLGKRLAEKLHPELESQSFTGGLLQDMAVPVLAHARPNDYGAILEEWHNSPDTRLHVIEEKTLGFSHDEVGALLGATWELPESLTRIIASHHDDDVATNNLPIAMRLVSFHRETEREYGFEALIEEARQHGIELDWLIGVLEESNEQAYELAKALR